MMFISSMTAPDVVSTSSTMMMYAVFGTSSSPTSYTAVELNEILCGSCRSSLRMLMKVTTRVYFSGLAIQSLLRMMSVLLAELNETLVSTPSTAVEETCLRVPHKKYDIETQAHQYIQ